MKTPRTTTSGVVPPASPTDEAPKLPSALSAPVPSGAPRLDVQAQATTQAWRSERLRAAATATVAYVDDLLVDPGPLTPSLVHSTAARLHSGWDAEGLCVIGREVLLSAQAAEIAGRAALAQALFTVAHGVIELAEKKLAAPSLVALKMTSNPRR